jgi:hypothetical protein
MKKVTLKNITKNMVPLSVKAIDGSITFTTAVKPNTSVELFESQYTGDVRTKLKYRWLVVVKTEDVPELIMKTTAPEPQHKTVETPSQITIKEQTSSEGKKKRGREGKVLIQEK